MDRVGDGGDAGVDAPRDVRAWLAAMSRADLDAASPADAGAAR